MSELWGEFFRKLEKITQGNTNAESLNYATHISLKYKYIYIETPKVACSSIKMALQRLELQMRDFERNDFEDLHVREFSPLLQLSQLPNFEQHLIGSDFFKFCFVRNPYTRLLSCYLDKIVKPKTYKEKKGLMKFMGLDNNEIDYPISFNDFISQIEKQSLLDMDYHWRPQTYLTCQSTIKYDFIGKLESFNSDFGVVGKMISSELDSYYSPEVRHQTDANKMLAEYYNDDLYNRVYNIYKLDFENFSYNKNP